MMFPIDDVIADIRAAAPLRRAAAGVRFERRVVEFLMRRLGLASHVARLTQEHQDRFGEPRLPFAAFHRLCPDFPVWLLARRVRNAFELSVDALADPKRVRKLNVVKAFFGSDDLLPQEWLAADRPRGVVFEWLNSGAPRGLWVLHDDPSCRQAVLGVNHPAVGRPARELRAGLQPFATFVDRLGYAASPG